MSLIDKQKDLLIVSNLLVAKLPKTQLEMHKMIWKAFKVGKNQQKNKTIEESEILLVKELIDKIRVFLSDYVPSPGPFFKWSNEYYEATEVLLKEMTKIENKLNI